MSEPAPHSESVVATAAVIVMALFIGAFCVGVATRTHCHGMSWDDSAWVVLAVLGAWVVACGIAASAAFPTRRGAWRRIVPLVSCPLVMMVGCHVAAGVDPGPPWDMFMTARDVAGQLSRQRARAGTLPATVPEVEAILGGATRPSGYFLDGRSLSMNVRVLTDRDEPTDEVPAGALPGTIVVSISGDRTSAWVRFVVLDCRSPGGVALDETRFSVTADGAAMVWP